MSHLCPKNGSLPDELPFSLLTSQWWSCLKASVCFSTWSFTGNILWHVTNWISDLKRSLQATAAVPDSLLFREGWAGSHRWRRPAKLRTWIGERNPLERLRRDPEGEIIQRLESNDRKLEESYRARLQELATQQFLTRIPLQFDPACASMILLSGSSKGSAYRRPEATWNLLCMECRWLKLKLGIEITKRVFACPREGVQGFIRFWTLTDVPKIRQGRTV